MLNVSVATLKRWASAGLIASERTSGGHRRFKASDLRLMVSPQAASGPGSWLEELFAADTPLGFQHVLLKLKLEAGSWAKLGDSLRPLIADLHRRREAGTLTVVEWLSTLERIERALQRFLDHVPVAFPGPNVLLTSIPGDRVLLARTVLELCALEIDFTPRLATGIVPNDLALELRRQGAHALIATGSMDSEPRALARYTLELAAVAAAARTPWAVIGTAAWPETLPGGARLTSFSEAQQWLERAAPEPRLATKRARPTADSPVSRRGRATPDPSAEGDREPLALTPSLAMGDALVDEQHRLLFQHGRRFIEAARNGSTGPRLRQLFTFLGDYAQVHFKAEENLMRAAHYPELDTHLGEHRDFAEWLRGVTLRLEAEGEAQAFRSDVANFVQGWLEQHVSSSDRHFALYRKRRESDKS